MNGYMSIDVPVKSYIKAFIKHEMGEAIKLSPGQHMISNKIYDLLEHSQNHQRTIAHCNYEDKIRIFISFETFRRRGHHLNHSNIRSFNRFVEKIIKYRFNSLMDDMIAVLPSFEANLPEVRRRIGIDLEAWSDDSMKKDYYRYRLRKNKPLLYKGGIHANIPQ